MNKKNKKWKAGITVVIALVLLLSGLVVASRVDTTPPVTTCTLDPPVPDGEGGWYVNVTDVTVTLSAVDNESGVDTTWYKIDDGLWKFYVSPFKMSDDGDHILYYYSFDRVGNKEDTKSVSVKIDRLDPVTTHELIGFIGKSGWYVSNVTVTLIPKDAGSGVNYTMYKIDNGAWNVYDEAFIVSGDGDHALYFYSVDNLRHGEDTNEESIKIEIDTIPPITTHQFEGTAGEGDWYRSTVTVTLTAEDGESGVDIIYYKIDEGYYEIYDNPFIVTGDDVHNIYYYSLDWMGNEEDENEVCLKIDQTLPTIDLSVEKVGMNWLFKATVSDETSGVAMVKFYLDEEFLDVVTEAPYELEWSGGGKHHVQAVVYDNAGNEGVSKHVTITSCAEFALRTIESIESITSTMVYYQMN